MIPKEEEMERFKLGHRPALDGVRGLAIALVVGFHVFGVAGGFAGVDLFFVLSGFLITSLLVEEHARSGHISLRAFYKRRALRLFPAVWLMVAVALVFGYFDHGFRAAEPFHDNLLGAAGAVGYFQNWLIVANKPDGFGYGQLWSLNIEEQFYLVWPILLILLLRFRSKLPLIGTIVFGGLASALYCAHSFAVSGWGGTYRNTGCRAFELMFGALAAVIVHSGWRPSRIIRWAGLPALGYLIFFFYTQGVGNPFVYDGGFELICVASVALVVSVLEPKGILYRVFSLKPARFLGRISYPLYLWHILVLMFIGEHLPTLNHYALEAIVISVSVVLATCSYYFLEQPIIRWGQRSHQEKAEKVGRVALQAPLPVG